MDNTEYLKSLAEAAKRAKQTELEQAKAAALKKIETEKSTAMPEYTKQKQQASVQSQLGAKNLAEYWANRGQTNAGISAQAELSRNNTLTKSIGDITTSENKALQGYNDQIADTETTYQNNLTSANNTIDTELATNLYNERVRQQEAAEAERIRLANIAADRATAAYKAQLDREEKANNAQVLTDYYQGDLNPNVQYGTFETLSKNGVKYQPNNVGKYTYTDNSNPYKPKQVTAVNTLSKYKSNGKAIKVGDYAKATGKSITGYTGADVSNQSVWVDKTGKAWFWDGSINDYRAL
jgi:hypothetical protein